MNQLAPDAFLEAVHVIPASEFVRLCNETYKRVYDLRAATSYDVTRKARALRGAMTGLCMAEMIESMSGLEAKRRAAIKAANDELARPR